MLYLLKKDATGLKDYCWYKPGYIDDLEDLPEETRASIFATRPDGGPMDACLISARLLASGIETVAKNGIGWHGTRRDPEVILDIFHENLAKMATVAWTFRGEVYMGRSDIGMFTLWKYLRDHYGHSPDQEVEGFVENVDLAMELFEVNLGGERVLRRSSIIRREAVVLGITGESLEGLESELSRGTPDLGWAQGAIETIEVMSERVEGTGVTVVDPGKVREVPMDKALSSRPPLEPGYAYPVKEIMELEDLRALYEFAWLVEEFPGIVPAVVSQGPGKRGLPGYMYVPEEDHAGISLH
nr:MAG TPA: hypothetical protein [Caudoviricetes sp.]